MQPCRDSGNTQLHSTVAVPCITVAGSCIPVVGPCSTVVGPCSTVVGPCSTVQWCGSTVVGPCSSVALLCRTVPLGHALPGHYRAAPCRWLYHRRVADHGVSYIIPFPSRLESAKCRPITAPIKININVLLVLQYTLKWSYDGQVFFASAFLLRPPNPNQVCSRVEGLQCQTEPITRQNGSAKEKDIGGCLPNLQYSNKCNLLCISFLLS